MWFVVLTSFVSGIIFILLVEVVLIYQWWIHKPKEKPSHKVNRSKVKNPEELANFFKKFAELATEDVKEQLRTPETCTCLNVIFAFLWREWRDSPQMKRLFIAKMTREFNDLIGAKAAKGIIEEISIKSYSLGESLPIIKDVRLIAIRSQSAEDVPDEIDMALNITYSGGFYVSADFALALNKSMFLSIKVVEITGKVKLSFRRYPTSRWSFSFFEEPEPKIELDAESRFEGKNFQQLTSLLLRHFKKVIRRKYILPNYVIRYKPFLREKLPQDEQNVVYIHNSQVTVGSVVVQVIGCSGLPLLKKSAVAGNLVFCSLSVDSIPFAERKNDDPSVWPVSECEVLRGNERKIGLTFHEVTSSEGDVSQKKIVVDNIDPESPAGHSSLKEGDIILEINGINVVDAKQVSKLIKTSSSRLSVLVKRPPSYMPITKTKELSKKIDIGTPLLEGNGEDCDEADAMNDEFINIVMPLIQMGSDQSESTKGIKDVSNSDHSIPLRYEFNIWPEKTMEDAQSSPIIIRKSYRKSNEHEELYSKSLAVDGEKAVNTVEKKTRSVKSTKSPMWNEEVELTVEKEHKYLNVLVWYKTRMESVKEDGEVPQTKDILLGYVTIPLTDIAVQCMETGDRFHQQDYVLVSTAYDKVLASRAHLNGHPGLNRVACCGDIALAFVYKPSFDTDDDSSVKTKILTSNQADKDLEESTDQFNTVDFEATKHNFVETQFHHPTKCDFCSKKIWTKSAYKCRLCRMACHKKCLQRAQMYTQCYSTQQDVLKPEEVDAEDSETRPNADGFQFDGDTLKEHGVDPSEISSMKSMSSAIRKVKSVGKELYPELSLTNRKIKLEEMINKLQNEIDEENEKKAKLYSMKKLPKPPYPISKIDQFIIKSEQKSESLKLLMLQFCSGLVSCESEV